MSWDDWVNGYILNHVDATTQECTYGICSRGGIYSFEDGTKWSSINFELMEYDLTLEDDNGKPISGKVNEWVNLKDAWNNKGQTKNFGGVRLNNEKFVLSRYDEDLETMYLTGKNACACVAKSEKTFCIGVRYKNKDGFNTSLGNVKYFSAGNVNGAVENCRKNLVENGY